MKLLLYITILSVFISACSDSDDSLPNSQGSPLESTNTIYVNSATGQDLPEYGQSRDMPYKTITYALSILDGINTIEVAAGDYNESTGEIFPIVVTTNKRLVGFEIDVAADFGAKIIGSGLYTSAQSGGEHSVAVVIEGALELGRVAISSEDGTALWVESAGQDTNIYDSAFGESDTGVVLVGSSSPKISNSVIARNLNVGIETNNSAMPTLTNTLITKNSVGIHVRERSSLLILANDTEDFTKIMGNSECDLLHSGVSQLNIVNTLWDRDVNEILITNECKGGTEIAVLNTIAQVNFLYLPPQDTNVFPNTDTVTLLQPAFNSIISSREPDFQWAGSGSTVAMMTIWEELPVFSEGKISPITSVVWLWHTGLGRSKSSVVQFQDGITPINGDIYNYISPQPLTPGKAYYWLVWEWDSLGLSITSSSPVGFFQIQP